MSIFLPNPNFLDDLMGEDDSLDALVKVAEPARDLAKGFAPVEEGDYRDGIEVRVVDRTVYLSGTDYKSHWIEFGTVDTPAFSPLRRGVVAAGLRLKDARP